MSFLSSVGEKLEHLRPSNLTNTGCEYSTNLVTGLAEGFRQATLGTIETTASGVWAAGKSAFSGAWNATTSLVNAAGSTLAMPINMLRTPFQPENHVGRPFARTGEAVKYTGDALIEAPKILVQTGLGVIHSGLLGMNRMLHATSGATKIAWDEATTSSTIKEKAMEEGWWPPEKITIPNFDGGSNYFSQSFNALMGGAYHATIAPFKQAARDISEYGVTEIGRRAEPPLKVLRAFYSLFQCKPFESWHHITSGMKFLVDRFNRWQLEAAIPFNFVHTASNGVGKFIAAPGENNAIYNTRTGLEPQGAA